MSSTTNDIIDAREREEALDPARSFIVEAPAGSGKTGLLMQRFLALLATVERPEELLALTFTKKAAGEMQRRIMESLWAASVGAEPRNGFEKKTLELAAGALKRDKMLDWRLLENPGRLQVRTIDSFCAGLSRQMPLLSRAGSLNVAEDASPYYEEAARRTVEMVEDAGVCGGSVRTALRHLDNSAGALMKRLVSMLEKRDQWLRHVRWSDTADELRGRLEGSFGRLVETVLEDARRAFPEKSAARLVRAARFAAGNLKACGSGSTITLLSGLEGLPGPGADSLGAWHGIAELLLTGDGSWRKPKGINAKQGFPAAGDTEAEAIRNDFQALLEELSGEQDLRDALREVKAAPSPVFEAYDWEALLAFLKLLPAAEAHLMDVFSERGAVDFQSVAASALKALGDDDRPTDLMLALDLRIRHILVDEYQDTSRAQLQLLRALTRGWIESDGRTLFIVGDPMQSIYMFREAEVGLFLDARINGVGPVRLDPLRLRCNFRSSPEIVGWVNGAFAGAFPDREDIFTGSVVYTPSVAAGSASGGGVAIRLFEGRDDAFEAKSVVGIIRDVRQKNPEESIAVLCRSRGHLAGIVQELKGSGFGFRARELDPLSGRPVVQDLLTLLRATLHPFDRVAWLAAIRAPWCGASLADLHALCAGDALGPIAELSEDIGRLAMLSDDGRMRVPPVIREIKKAAGNLGRAPLRPLIEGLWISLGGPACVDAAGLADASEFFGVLESAEGVGTLGAVEEKVEKLFAHHGGDASTAIDLMTIHRAKGLEFDNVIIPGLGKLPRHEDKKLMLWLERNAHGADDLLLAPIEKKTGAPSPLYGFLSRINKKKSALELARLFYVAATRARKGLYLFGHTGDGEGARERSMLSVIRLEGMTPEPVEDGTGLKKMTGVRIKRLSGSWSMPAPAPAVTASVEKEAGREEPEFRWAGERIRHLGTVVHRYLCRIAGEGLDKWDATRLDKESGRAASVLRGLGLPEAEAAEFAEKAVQMLKGVLRDERGRWVLGAHAEGGVEEAVTGVVDGGVERAVIDRTFVDESGARWVIDYKTGIHEGGSRKEFLESEKERYRPQLERYAAILREAEGGKREIRLGLYFPALREFVEV